MSTTVKFSLLVGVVLGLCPGSASMAETLPSFADSQAIGDRLYRQLSDKQKSRITPPIPSLIDSALPIFGISESPRRVVVNQVGLDFIVAFSKAKAIDSVQKGYLRNYLSTVAKAGPVHPIPPLPDTGNARFQQLDVENEFLTNFNQIFGGLLAVRMAQIHSPPQSAGGNISDPKESWQSSLAIGVTNAVSCAYGVEGLSVFWEQIEGLKNRPAWMNGFLPPDGRGRKAANDAQKIQKQMLK